MFFRDYPEIAEKIKPFNSRMDSPGSWTWLKK